MAEWAGWALKVWDHFVSGLRIEEKRGTCCWRKNSTLHLVAVRPMPGDAQKEANLLPVQTKQSLALWSLPLQGHQVQILRNRATSWVFAGRSRGGRSQADARSKTQSECSWNVRSLQRSWTWTHALYASAGDRERTSSRTTDYRGYGSEWQASCDGIRHRSCSVGYIQLNAEENAHPSLHVSYFHHPADIHWGAQLLARSLTIKRECSSGHLFMPSIALVQ